MVKNNKKNTINIENRKAHHDYYIQETLECGIELRGNEVKSIRDGKASIKESWVNVENGQLYIKNMHIAKWDTSNIYDIDEKRVKRLLAHKKEIYDLSRKSQLQGYTIVPIKVYISNSKIKVLIALCKGKHNYDKRNTLREKAIKMDLARSTKEKY